VKGALHLPGWRLWLDAHEAIRRGESVFVSHAHSDHTARHAEVYLTEATRRLMRARIGGERTEHALAFGERRELAEGALTLLPAGHILGSAMSLLEGAEGSLLYTGDFKLRRGMASEVCEPRKADVLVMETTFGRPKYVFPPVAEVVAGIHRFCQETLEEGGVPILLGYSLGKAQEILACLSGAGLPIMVTEPVAKMTRVYADLGHVFPEFRLLEVEQARGHVVVAPPGSALKTLREGVGRSRVGVITGWAMDPGCRFRYQADAAFPLSDHADYPELMELVRRVEPKVVYTVHGFATQFAADLRRAGVEAWALGRQEQLELGLG
jgi:Cft2 family RNA processing exonuclease